MPKSKVLCRLCRGTTTLFLDLGRVPLPEEFRIKKHRNDPLVTYALRLSYCPRCHHVQLRDIPDMNAIYKKNYCYDFSLTQTGRDHWEKLARDLTKRYHLTARSLVVDVGSNTGQLLRAFRKHAVNILGVDPSPKVASLAIRSAIPTIVGYFQPALAKKIVRTHGQANLITSTNVFDHVGSLFVFVESLAFLLHPDGVIVIEVPYALRMLRDGSHIPYLQQLDYMFLSPLIPFFTRHGFSIVDAAQIPMHGGSLRLIIQGKGARIRQSASMQKLLIEERIFFSSYRKRLQHFSRSIRTHYRQLSLWVRAQRKAGKHIAGIGASAKGMTLLSCIGVDGKDIDFVTEKSSMKIGKYTPLGIPVLPDTAIPKYLPDIGIILAWNFEKEIKKNIPGFTGVWYTPMPITL